MDLNFARIKPEGQPAVKAGPPQKQFHCWDCGYTWDSNPKSFELYYEYDGLKNETFIPVQDRDAINKIPPPYISYEKLHRLKEVAKILVESHRHTLDIGPSEWYDIERDALV